MAESDIESFALLGHLNLIELSRESTRWGLGGAVDEQAGHVLFATGSSLPVMCNGAFRGDQAVDPTELITRADGFFGARNRGYTVMVRSLHADDDLRIASEAAGLVAFGNSSPEMVCTAPVSEQIPDGVGLRPVTTGDQVLDFAAVSSDAYGTYGMPAEAPVELFSRPGCLIGSPHVQAVVAYVGGAPAAAALVLLSHGIAGVYWVGTIERARGAGLGRCVPAAVTNAAFERGARAVTLQASTMGEPIYRAMGFEALHHYDNWVRFSVPGPR